MQKTNIPQAESKSADLVAQNLEQMKQIFPEVIKEGRVDFEALNDLLGNYADTAEERFALNWAGKANARREAQKRSTGTLRPCPEESVDWDSTENLYIEGDNLEVLKLLQKSYHSRIKMIYIDPPYNTGKDFVYKDNYKDNMKNYLELTGQDKKLSTNTESDGRYHSNWLNMMYPRLKLARNLLTDDGVIFISIDDNEVANLLKVCDEIFGEENVVGCAGRITKKSNNKGDFWAPNFDYLVTCVKNIDLAEGFLGGINYEAYNQVEENGDRKGEKYQLVRLYMSTIENRNPEQRFWIDCPDGSRIIPPGTTFPPERPNLGDGIWRWTKKKFEEEKDKIVIKRVRSSNLLNEKKEPAEWNVYTKTYLNDVIDKSSAKPNSFIENHINQIGSHELNSLSIPFDYSKPSTLIKYLIEVSKTKGEDIILDFFSGSATTAHAVMQLNSEDGGNRKYICVQIPEPTPEESEARKAGYATIPEIAKERIRRAGKKIVEEQKAKAEKEGGLFAEEEKKLDIGFKVFKLDSSNINAWDSDPDNLETALNNSLFNIKEDRSEDDLLYEILIKYGIELTVKINRHTIDGKTVYEMGAGSLIVCLAESLSTAVADGIGKLYKEVSPEGVDANCRVVFKEAGFNGSDEVKTNTLLILKQHGITNVATV